MTPEPKKHDPTFHSGTAKITIDEPTEDWNEEIGELTVRFGMTPDNSAERMLTYLRVRIKELLTQARREESKKKDDAYHERDMLVAALSKCFPSYLARHDESDKDWEDEWRWIVYIDLPTGQVSWHIHDSEREMFNHLEVKENNWDGHNTQRKYERLEALSALSSVVADTRKRTLDEVRDEVKRILEIQFSGVRPTNDFEKGYTTAYQNMYSFCSPRLFDWSSHNSYMTREEHSKALFLHTVTKRLSDEHGMTWKKAEQEALYIWNVHVRYLIDNIKDGV